MADSGPFGTFHKRQMKPLKRLHPIAPNPVPRHAAAATPMPRPINPYPATLFAQIEHCNIHGLPNVNLVVQGCAAMFMMNVNMTLTQHHLQGWASLANGVPGTIMHLMPASGPSMCEYYIRISRTGENVIFEMINEMMMIMSVNLQYDTCRETFSMIWGMLNQHITSQ